MNPPEHENFDSLRGLLKLKRYEQPPPGYFDRFHRQVIARIEAGELGEPDSIVARLFGENSWWQRMSEALQARPGFAGAFGAAVCALLISGIVYSGNSPAPVVQGILPGAAPGSASAFPGSGLAVANVSMEQPDLNSGSGNSLTPTEGSLFDMLPLPQAEPASLTIPTGN